MTNAHVIAGAAKITVTLYDEHASRLRWWEVTCNLTSRAVAGYTSQGEPIFLLR